MKPHKTYSVAHLVVKPLPQQEVHLGQVGYTGQWGLFTGNTLACSLDSGDVQAARVKAARMGFKFVEGSR